MNTQIKPKDIFSEEDIKKIKELCIMYDAQYIKCGDIKFIVPLDKWKYEVEIASSLNRKTPN